MMIKMRARKSEFSLVRMNIIKISLKLTKKVMVELNNDGAWFWHWTFVASGARHIEQRALLAEHQKFSVHMHI